MVPTTNMERWSGKMEIRMKGIGKRTECRVAEYSNITMDSLSKVHSKPTISSTKTS